MKAQLNPCALSNYGDSYVAGFKVDRLPDTYDLGDKGERNLWLFQNLQSVTYEEFRLTRTSIGKFSLDYPEADYVMIAPGGTEVYLTKSQNTWSQVSKVMPQQSGELPMRYDFNIPLKTCFPSPDDRLALYGTTFPWMMASEDKATVRISISDQPDAQGKLYLPEGIYDAYRIERKVTHTSQTENAVNEAGLVDYNSYIFLDIDTKELLMEVRMELDGSIDWIKYRASQAGTILNTNSGINQFALYPSPSFGDNLRLDFRNFEKGNYTLHVYNVFGKLLWSQNYNINSDTTIKADLSFLPKGTYTYRLQDEDRNTIVARRMAIINP